MASIKNRIEKLEASAKIQAIRHIITRIIVEPDGTLLDAIQRDASGNCVSISDEELSRIVRKNY